MLHLTTEMMRKINTETLIHLIEDAKERISSSPELEQYVQDQQSLINKCREVLDERGVQ